jgi:hypothetical protein
MAVKSKARTTAAIKEYREKGPALVIEDEDYLGRYFHASDLKMIMNETSSNKIDIVFCHSELAASIFLDAGVRHVISLP